MEYGGNGFNTSGIGCDFMFPDDSDQQQYWGTNGVVVAPWSETSAGNPPGDRRFIQSAGPFTLEPGAVNYITTGAVWAQASPGGGPWSAVQNLKKADDLAQALFDNDFQILNGPDAKSFFGVPSGMKVVSIFLINLKLKITRKIPEINKIITVISWGSITFIRICSSYTMGYGTST